MIISESFLTIFEGSDIFWGIFADAQHGLALYMCQTLIRGWYTFSLTCVERYFKPLIINQVTELTWLWYDLYLLWYWFGPVTNKLHMVNHSTVQNMLVLTPPEDILSQPWPFSTWSFSYSPKPCWAQALQTTLWATINIFQPWETNQYPKTISANSI